MTSRFEGDNPYSYDLEIFRRDNEAVVDFVYSSNLFKKVREAYLKE